MKYLAPFIIVLLSSFFVIGQEDDEFRHVELECKAVSNSDVGMEGVSMKIYQAGKLVEENISDALGNYKKITVFGNIKLLIVFSKEGYVTKSIEVDTFLEKSQKAISKDNIFPSDITMLKVHKGKDYSIISDEPIASIVVNKNTGKLTYDIDYIERRRKEIETSLFKN